MSLVQLLNPDTSPSQRAAVQIIEDEFRAAGFPLALAAAAAVNAYAESGLDPSAKWASMYGLFQLDNKYGLGIGMTPAQLLDGRTNTRKIIEAIRGSYGRRLLEAVNAGERHPHTLAGLFARIIERPKDVEDKVLHREGLTWVLFPGLVRPNPADVVLGAVAGVAESIPGLTDAQRQAATLIEVRFSAAGLPPEIIAAAIANAWAESRLNPKALAVEESGSRSVGLFQLNDAPRAAGAGMSVEDRSDPQKNIDRMLQVYRTAGRRLEDAYTAGVRDVGQLAALWTEDLERPKDASAVGVVRRALAYRLFPTWQHLHELADKVATPAAEAGAGAAVLLTGLAVGGLVVGLAAKARRGRR